MNTKTLGWAVLLTSLILLLTLLLFLSVKTTPLPQKGFLEEKITGVSFVGSRREIGPDHLEPVTRVGARWISVMHYAFSRPDSNYLWQNVERQWWGEKKVGVCQHIRVCVWCVFVWA